MSYLVDVSGNPILGDVVTQGTTVNALNGAVTLQLRGQASASFQLTGIGSLTMAFEATIDGVNFFAIPAFPVGGGAAVTTTTANGQWTCNTVGFFQVRARCSAFTSGSVLVSGIASQGSDSPNATNSSGSGRVDLISVAGTALGTPTNFGTGPGAVVAESVNASLFGGTSAAGGATGAAVPAGALLAAARAMNANPTAVANGQLVAIAADLAGRVITQPLNYRTLFGQTATTISATGATTIVAAGAASVFRDLLALIITTAGAAAQTITISDGTLSWILDYPNAALAPASPLIIVFGDTPLRATAAATAWTANQGAATACHYLAQYVERLA